MQKPTGLSPRKIWLAAAGLAVLGAVLTGGALAQRHGAPPSEGNPASPVTPPRSSIPDPSNLESYWTQERMNSVSPEPLRGP